MLALPGEQELLKERRHALLLAGHVNDGVFLLRDFFNHAFVFIQYRARLVNARDFHRLADFDAPRVRLKLAGQNLQQG